MSYILEALKKADQERARGSIPDLAADHAAPESAAPGRSPWLWLVAGLVVVNLLWLAVYLRNQANPSDAQEVRVEPMPAPVQPPSPAMTSTPETVIAGPASAQAVPERAVPEPRILLAPPPAVPSTDVRRPQAGSDVAAVSEAASGREVYAITPWQQASSGVQRLASGLSLDVHVYSEQPAQRFVLINMTKYREGDELREGAVLEQITAQGVVMSYQGEQFRYDKP